MTRFIGSQPEIIGSKFALFGVPYDGTASFRPGARFGPDAIRTASDGLETYSPRLDRDLGEIRFSDLGDIDVGFGASLPAILAARDKAEEILALGTRPFMLGGEHSLTAGPVEACLKKHSNLTVLQIDAHADLRQEYLDDPHSHACVMNRCLELGANLAQFGIRSGTKEEFARMRDGKTFDEEESLSVVLSRIKTPVYLTLDIDVFDPSVVPGTGTPEPGGISWRDFEAIIDALTKSSVDVVGLDVMELAPQLDPSGVSSVVAAKCVRELMLAVS